MVVLTAAMAATSWVVSPYCTLEAEFSVL